MTRRCRHQCECRDADSVVLEVLCRVFHDGADQGMEEWRAFYQPEEWLGWPRALGAFIYTRLKEREGRDNRPTIDLPVRVDPAQPLYRVTIEGGSQRVHLDLRDGTITEERLSGEGRPEG